MVNLSAVGYAVRKSLSANGITLATGHVQQLVAAALGHNNLASYQQLGDDAALAEASDIVLDRERLLARASVLGHDGHAFASVLTAALSEHLVNARVYGHHDEWAEDVQLHFELALVKDESVNSQVAMTNGGSPQTWVDLPWWDRIEDFDGNDLSMEFDGVVSVEQDEDRVYWGNRIDVRAQLTVERLGRRVFGKRLVDVESAQLRWFGETTEMD